MVPSVRSSSTQTVTVQRLALLHRPPMNEELDDVTLNQPNIFEDVYNKFCAIDYNSNIASVKLSMPPSCRMLSPRTMCS